MPTLKTPQRFEIDPKDGHVHLRYGDVTYLADKLGKSASHVGRTISDPVHRASSPELRAALQKLIGVPLQRVRLPQRKARKKKR